jgi:hypothetical protein
VRYVEECTAVNEPYEKPGSSACFGSIESARKCAFGLRDTCKRCPHGAICPGGNEARSFPGFFTLSSDNGIVEQCPPPEAERCTGWNAQTLATRCGKAYSGQPKTVDLGCRLHANACKRAAVSSRSMQVRCANRARPASTFGRTGHAPNARMRRARLQ